MTSAFEVGKPYSARTRWPEGSQYNFRGGGHELLLLFASPSDREVTGVRKAPVELALVVEGPLVVLSHRFGDALPWGDSPFSWHLLPESERVYPPPWEDGSPEQRALLAVFLVDAATGILRALRQLTMAPDFTRAIHRAIVEQAQQPWNAAAYDAALERLYQRYPSSEALQVAAIARTRGGS